MTKTLTFTETEENAALLWRLQEFRKSLEKQFPNSVNKEVTDVIGGLGDYIDDLSVIVRVVAIHQDKLDEYEDRHEDHLGELN